MKKNLLNWMTILMVAIVSVSFVSCSGDDENRNENGVSIVGTWRCEFSAQGYSTLTFNSDGTGRYMEFDHGKWEDDKNFKYVYSNDKLYYTYFSESKEREYTEVYEVVSLTATKLLIKDFGDLGVSTYIRQ